MVRRERPPAAPQSGKLSCFFQGSSTSFERSSASAREMRLRVEWGMNHLVDVAALGGREGAHEPVLVFLGAGCELLGVVRVLGGR